jgi:hypothetical protein
MQNIAGSFTNRVVAFSLAATLIPGVGGIAVSDAEAKSSPQKTTLKVGESGLYKKTETAVEDAAKARELVFSVKQECDYRRGSGGVAIGLPGAGAPAANEGPHMTNERDIQFRQGGVNGGTSGSSGQYNQERGGKKITGDDFATSAAGAALANTRTGNAALDAVAGQSSKYTQQQLRERFQVCTALIELNGKVGRGGMSDSVLRDNASHIVSLAEDAEMAHPANESGFGKIIRRTKKGAQAVTGGIVDELAGRYVPQPPALPNPFQWN